MSQTALAFLLMFGTGCLAALFVRPIYGLYLYLAVFYLDPPSRWWGVGLPSDRWSLIAAAVTLLALFIHKGSVKRDDFWLKSGVAKILVIYTAWMWIQLPWVVSPLQLEGTILYSKYTLLFYLMYRLIDTEDDFAHFCLAHVLGCAFLGWLIYLAPDAGRLESVGGPGIGNANTLGMHLATGLITGGLLLFAQGGWKRWLIVGVIPLIVNGLFQTETRGAFIGLFLGGLATIYLKPKSIRKRFYALAVLGIVGALSFANEALITRLSTVQAAVDESAEWDNSAKIRVELAAAQLEMFVDYPLGAGHQGTAILSPRYMDRAYLVSSVNARASHNTILTVLVDQGIPGIVLFVILAILIVKMLRRLKFLDRTGLPDRQGVFRAMVGGVLCTIIGAGMFAQYFKAEVLIWSLALLAILWRFSGESRLAETNSPASAPVANNFVRTPKA